MLLPRPQTHTQKEQVREKGKERPQQHRDTSDMADMSQKVQIFSLSLFSLSYELILRPDENQMEVRKVLSYPQYYVWDHVAVALHVDRQVPLFIYDLFQSGSQYFT